MVYFLSKVELKAIAQAIANASLSWIVMGFLGFIIYQIFRTARFSVLIHSRKGELFNLFSIQCIHGFLNNVLPAGTGELAYIVVLKRLHRIPVAEGVTTLYLARTADFAVFVLLFGFLHLFNLVELPGVVTTALQWIEVLTVFLVGLAIIVTFAGHSIMNKVRLAVQPHIDAWPTWLRLVSDKISETIDSFGAVRSIPVYLLVFLYSIAMWGFMYLTYFAVIRSIQLDLTLGEVLFLFLVMWPITILPIKGVLNLGTFEGGWVLGLSLLGVSQSTAIAVALSAHTIIFVYVIGALIFPFVLYSPSLIKNFLKSSFYSVARR